MKAIVTIQGKSAALQEHPKPTIEPTEVLVNVKAAAHNPTDWKHVKYLTGPGNVCGCDFAGVVAQVGSDVKDVKVGDRIAGAVHGGSYPEFGSFAEYCRVDPKLAFVVPESLAFTDAAAYGVCAGTAAFALFQQLGLKNPREPYSKDETKPKVLIWGASSYVGVFAIQLAKLSGARVVATASPYAHEQLKALGAEVVFDYRDPEAGKKILEWAGGDLTLGLDCISEDSTVPLASNALSGGSLVLLLGGSVKHKDNNPKVTFKPILLYSMFGKAFTKMGHDFPPSPKDYEFAVWWHALLTELVKDQKLKTININVIGGLESFQDGFDRLSSGKVRTEKLVMSL